MPIRPVMFLAVKIYASENDTLADTLADALNDADLRTHIHDLVTEVMNECLPVTSASTPEWFTVEVTEV